MDEILGYRVIDVPTLDFKVLDVLLHLGPESDGGGIHALVDYLFQASERPTVDEQDVCRIDLDEVTPGILAPGFLSASERNARSVNILLNPSNTKGTRMKRDYTTNLETKIVAPCVPWER